MLRHGRFRPRLSRSRFAVSGDPYGRTFLADAATGLLLPGFTYTRSGPDLWCPQADGSLASFAANVIPREFAGGRWGFRFDPGWTQSLLRTHELGNAAWTPNGIESVVQDGASFGGSASWRIVESATSTYRYTQQSASFIAGQAYTITAVVSNRAGARFVQLRFPASAFGAAVQSSVNPRSGASQALFGATVHPSVQVAGGWLVSVTAVATASASGVVRVQLASNQATADEIYLGDGVSGVNVWGVNLTNTAYPVPLAVAQGTAGTVGNHGCSATLAALGITLGGEWTVGCDYVPTSVDAAFGTGLRLDNGTNAERAIIRRNSSNSASRHVIVASGGVAQYQTLSSSAVGELSKVALRVKTNDLRGCANGALFAADDGAGVVPTVSRITVGHGVSAGSEVLPGRIIDSWIIPGRALTDAELQAITA